LEEFYYTLELIISPYLPERSCIILTKVSNPTQYKNDETEHFILQIYSYITFRFHHAITLEMKNINDEKSIFVDCCDLLYDDDQHRLLLLEKEINVTKNFIKDAEEYFDEKMREPLIIQRVYGCKNTEDQITNT